jgi:hypothetical protein
LPSSISFNTALEGSRNHKGKTRTHWIGSSNNFGIFAYQVVVVVKGTWDIDSEAGKYICILHTTVMQDCMQRQQRYVVACWSSSRMSYNIYGHKVHMTVVARIAPEGKEFIMIIQPHSSPRTTSLKAPSYSFRLNSFLLQIYLNNRKFYIRYVVILSPSQ